MLNLVSVFAKQKIYLLYCLQRCFYPSVISENTDLLPRRLNFLLCLKHQNAISQKKCYMFMPQAMKKNILSFQLFISQRILATTVLLVYNSCMKNCFQTQPCQELCSVKAKKANLTSPHICSRPYEKLVYGRKWSLKWEQNKTTI